MDLGCSGRDVSRSKASREADAAKEGNGCYPMRCAGSQSTRDDNTAFQSLQQPRLPSSRPLRAETAPTAFVCRGYQVERRAGRGCASWQCAQVHGEECDGGRPTASALCLLPPALTHPWFEPHCAKVQTYVRDQRRGAARTLLGALAPALIDRESSNRFAYQITDTNACSTR